MAVIAAPELATPPNEPQSIAVLVGELMPPDSLTYTSVVLSIMEFTPGGGGGGEDATVGYAG